MKKLFCFLAIIATFGLINIPAFATEAPSYDSTYNSNTGAFFANGTPIVISEVDGNTVITWDKYCPPIYSLSFSFWCFYDVTSFLRCL